MSGEKRKKRSKRVVVRKVPREAKKVEVRKKRKHGKLCCGSWSRSLLPDHKLQESQSLYLFNKPLWKNVNFLELASKQDQFCDKK